MVWSRRSFFKTGLFTFTGLIIGYDLKGSVGRFLQKLSSILINNEGNIISDLSAWIKQREVITKRWGNYLGILKPNSNPPKLRIIAEEEIDGLIRQHVEYESESGLFVKGYLLKPKGIVKPLPGVVALHSTSDNKMLYIAGIETGKIVQLGFKMAKQGFVVFCPMCFLWHEKEDKTYEQQVEIFQERHPYSKGMAKMLFDAQRAVDVLVSLKEVDSNRIGALGHSLGAKEAFYLGAFDDRVKVIVSNEGGIGIDFSNWDAPWYLGKEINSFGHEHHELLALCAPKPFLLIGGDSADGSISNPYIDAVKPVYELYGKPQNIYLFNHGQGHMIAPEAEKLTYDWIAEHL
jgi:Dienelactone hydrolase family